MNKPQTRTFRARVRAARPVPSRAFQRGIDHTLAHLPPREAKKPLRSSSAFWPMAAALVLALALAGPPVVRAAGIWLEKLFSGTVERIEQQQAQPEDLRIADGVASQEVYHRSHALHETAQVGNVTVALTGVMLHRGDDDSQPTLGELWPSLSYPNAPADFDPALIDFTITANGQTIPQVVDEMLTMYRQDRRKAGDGEGDWAGVYFVDGVMHSHIAFPFDNWQTEEKVDFVLSAAFPDGQLNLPFTYDPALAHAEAQQEAAEQLAVADQMQQEKLQTFTQLAAHAIPLGLTVANDGLTVTLTEMALVDGNISFTANISGHKETRAKLAGMSIYLEKLRIDGQPMSSGHDLYYEDEMVNGVYACVESRQLTLEPSALPETSLFFLEWVYQDAARAVVPMVFRYNWMTQTMTAPADDAERQAWLEQEWDDWQASMHSEANSDQPKNDIMFYPNIAQTNGDLTMTLSNVAIWPDGSWRFQFDSSKALTSQQLGARCESLFNGADIVYSVGGFESNPQKTMMYRDLPMRIAYAELPEQAPLTLKLKLPGYDQPFVFDLILDKKDAFIY